MPDPDKSGAPDPASADLPATPPAAPPSADSRAAADTPSTPATTPASAGDSPALPAETAPKAGAFGSTRGSGLVRGKRPATGASPAAGTASPGSYKPTALEVITPQSEYKNPFTGQSSVSSPPANEPASAVPSPKAEAPQAAPPPPPAPPAADLTEATAKPAVVDPLAPAAGIAPPREPEARTELNILPPEASKRPTVHWEAGGAPAAASQRDERPTFQPRDRRDSERPDPRGPEARESRSPDRSRREPRPFEPRERREGERREPRKFEPRSQQPYQPTAPRPEPAKKPAGFVGWLKRLFSGDAPAEPTPAPSTRRDEAPGQQFRHRGGRGRGGQGRPRDEQRGPREGQPHSPGGDPSRGDELRGQGDTGPRRRRRRRGGRGRHHGDGGDRGPRPEGQQGGGAI